MLHVCNDVGVMGSGIALEVKNRLPDAYRAYRAGGLYPLQVGTISASENVINLVAQRGYGQGIRHLDYEALYKCLEKARGTLEYIDPGREWRVGIPYKMGSDRAGGNWGVVLAMVAAAFKDSKTQIYIIKYEMGMR
jgi:hypothetical protein